MLVCHGMAVLLLSVALCLFVCFVMGTHGGSSVAISRSLFLFPNPSLRELYSVDFILVSTDRPEGRQTTNRPPHYRLAAVPIYAWQEVE